MKHLLSTYGYTGALTILSLAALTGLGLAHTFLQFITGTSL